MRWRIEIHDKVRGVVVLEEEVDRQAAAAVALLVGDAEIADEITGDNLPDREES